MEKATIQELSTFVLAELNRLGYASETITIYRRTYQRLIRYAEANQRFRGRATAVVCNYCETHVKIGRFRVYIASFDGKNTHIALSIMVRAKRYYFPGQIWHITHRCHKNSFYSNLVKDRRRCTQ